jgi:hypothetical protein
VGDGGDGEQGCFGGGSLDGVCHWIFSQRTGTSGM